MNLIDSLIKPLAPSWALKRAQSRHMLALYESAKPTRTRRNPSDNRSGNALTEGAAETMRGQARHLEQNHDLCRGILTCLVNNVVGPKGIGVEFQPKNSDGTVNKALADELNWYFAEWGRRPETTGEYSWARTQRMMARSWFRDGEVLSKSIMGNVPLLQHATMVPYSLELLEADHIADLNDEGRNIIQGIERNQWGRTRFVYLYDQHPGDASGFRMRYRRTAAEDVDHLKMTDRIRQNRGVSIFAAVMGRLNDLKDYEESERVAARISAAMAMYIQKGSPELYVGSQGEEEEDREFPVSPGTVFDNLMPGEKVETIQSNRPSQLLQPFRDSMLKAIASGTGAGNSTISKNYDGTYSAQRQELVEQWVNYAALSDEFISGFVAPVVRRFIRLAIMSGRVTVPAGVDRDTLMDVDYLTPAMPWIDPKKEAEGHEANLRLRITSPQKIIRSRGDNPDEVLDQIQQWNQKLEERSIKVEPEPANERAFSSQEDE
ncbi:phage portal protein [Marinobacter salarius]|uniref:phage portal protein n=1 Tax=Marinobacter salarius TaxID=1420917 RepID=UPI003BA85989